MSYETAMKDEIDLGDDHRMVFAEYEGEKRVGAQIIHKAPDGTDCRGWIPFEGRAWASGFAGSIATWKVERDEPLTLSPSVLCRACGDHGFVRSGKWVRA